MYSFPMHIPEYAARFPAQVNIAKQFNWVVVLPEEAAYMREGMDFISFSVIFHPHDDLEKDLNKEYIIDFEADFTIYRHPEEGPMSINRKVPLRMYLRDLDKIHQVFISLPDIQTGDFMHMILGRKGCEHGRDTFDGHMEIWGGTIDVNMDWEIKEALPSIAPVAEREPIHIRMN